MGQRYLPYGNYPFQPCVVDTQDGGRVVAMVPDSAAATSQGRLQMAEEIAAGLNCRHEARVAMSEDKG